SRPDGYAATLRRRGREALEASVESKPGREAEKYAMHAFGAVFAEVAVDPDLGDVRVRRIVGAYDIGRVLNPRLARSQAIDGMTMGIGMALLEGAHVDRRECRAVTANPARSREAVHA